MHGLHLAVLHVPAAHMVVGPINMHKMTGTVMHVSGKCSAHLVESLNPGVWLARRTTLLSMRSSFV